MTLTTCPSNTKRRQRSTPSPTSTSTLRPGRQWASSAAQAPPRAPWCSSSPGSTTPPQALSGWAAGTCARTAWRPSGTRWALCSRKTSSSPAPSGKTSCGASPGADGRRTAGGLPRRLRRRVYPHPARRGWTPGPGPGRGQPVRAGRSSACASPGRCSKQPKVLIFDDSTSAVDTATEGRIRAALWQAIPDMTKIVIAQRVTVRHARGQDRASWTTDGSTRWAPTELSWQRDPIYQEIYDSQMKGGR